MRFHLKRVAQNYVNYQQRATEFSVGDVVVPYGYYESHSGRVVALYPGIGMADVEFASGAKRYPVEELQRINPETGSAIPPRTNSVPGEIPVTTVSGGPFPQKEAAVRVASSYIRNALYWYGPDRKYRLTRVESNEGSYYCPKCDQIEMKKTVYKRMKGTSEKLFGCPSCLFLIKELDIIRVGE